MRTPLEHKLPDPNVRKCASILTICQLDSKVCTIQYDTIQLDFNYFQSLTILILKNAELLIRVKPNGHQQIVVTVKDFCVASNQVSTFLGSNSFLTCCKIIKSKDNFKSQVITFRVLLVGQNGTIIVTWCNPKSRLWFLMQLSKDALTEEVIWPP